METHETQFKDDHEFRQYLKFANKALSKVILDDLNEQKILTSFYTKYKKEDIIRWLSNPEYYYLKIKEVCTYIYGASNHFRRIVSYFSKIGLFAYYIVPTEINDNIDVKQFNKNYKKVSNMINGMNIKHEFSKITDVCFRQDIFYGYLYHSENFESFHISELPYKFCKISAIEDGCFLFSFNFEYFNTHPKKLAPFGIEFIEKYNLYKNGKASKWQELDSKKTICIKFDESISYPLPPLVGVLPELFDLQEYKLLKKASEQMGNYALLSMHVPMNKDGSFAMDFEEAVKYYQMTAAQVPDNIGVALSPMKMEKYTFDKAGLANVDSVANATESFWNSAGVSSLLFSSNKSGNSVINASIEVDSTYVYSMYRKFERWLNYKIKQQFPNDKYIFKVTMLDATVFNKTKLLDEYLKMGAYGLPVINKIGALVGDTQEQTNGLLFMEQEVNHYNDKLQPLNSSHTQSSLGGAPTKNDEDLTDSGNTTRERDEKKNE